MTTLDYFNSCFSMMENTPVYKTITDEYKKTKKIILYSYILILILLIVIIILLSYNIYKLKIPI